MRRTVWAAVLLTAFGTTALLAGCSSGTPGQAQATSTDQTTSSATTQSSPTSSGSQAPKVAKPLDASKMVANPCSALTPADVATLQITNPITRSGTDSTGAQCGWQGATGGNIGIGWATTNTGGLSDLYAKSNTIAYWQPTTVAGYPAAFGDSISDGRPQGDCVINVGVNDHLTFFAQYDNPSNAGQSCDLAKQAASNVIKNLGGS